MTQLDQALPAKARRTGRDRATGWRDALIERQAETWAAVREDGAIAGSVSGGCIEEDLIRRAAPLQLARAAAKPALAAAAQHGLFAVAQHGGDLAVDVAVDPVEGTNLLAYGRPNAIAVVGLSPNQSRPSFGAPLAQSEVRPLYREIRAVFSGAVAMVRAIAMAMLNSMYGPMSVSR